MDEFAVRRGHRYMTVVLDLESGWIVHVGEGKGADALKPFLRRLRKNPPLAIAMDMSDPYLKAVREVLGDAVQVVDDPCHVVAMANRAVDETRRPMMRQLEKEDKQVLKGARLAAARAGEPERGLAGTPRADDAAQPAAL